MIDPLKALGGGIDALDKMRTSPISQQHIDLLKTALAQAEKETARLQTELAEERRARRAAEQQLAANSERDGFVVHRGAAFRRDGRGGFDRAVYCPSCKISVLVTRNGFFDCRSCGWMLNTFHYRDLSKIIEELAALEPSAPRAIGRLV